MTTNEELIGREDINDLEAILGRHQHRPRRGRSTRSRTTPRPSSRGTTRRGSGRRSTACTRRPRSRCGTARPTCRGTPRSTRRRSSPTTPWPVRRLRRRHRRERHPDGALGRAEVARVRRREPELDAQPVHARRAGRAVCTAKIVETVPWIDAKYYASTQVMDEARHVEVFAKYLDTKLSGHYPINAHLQDAPRRHRRGLPLGHDLPRHADHGGGPGARRLRLHAPDDHRAAAQAAAPLRHERRGPPRRLRRALAEGVLRGADRRRDARAPAVRVRGRGAHARPVPPAGGVGAHGHRSEGRRRAW